MKQNPCTKLIGNTTPVIPRTDAAALWEALVECETADQYNYGPVNGWNEHSDDACVVPMQFGANDELIIVSDLHLSSGKAIDGNNPPTENFFADEAFRRFLVWHDSELKIRKAHGVLFINGDFLDLLRIIRVPATVAEFVEWEQLLADLSILDKEFNKPFTAMALCESVTEHEEDFGLRTNDFKSVWKFAAAIAGHESCFQALANWLSAGHDIVILKGNHDLEWRWPEMRRFFRLAMADRMSPLTAVTACLALKGRIHFVDDALLVNDHLYVEHGHRFEKWTRPLGPAIWKDSGGTEINLPAGSFMNRYVINRIESLYPYLDNIRPAPDVLPLLFRGNFLFGLHLLLKCVPGALRMMGKRYRQYMFRRVIPFLAVLPAVGVVAVLNYSTVYEFLTQGGWWKSLLAGYVLPQLIAWFQLHSPDSFAMNAEQRANAHPIYRCIVMGHTHLAEQMQFHSGATGCMYYNTGSWIPIVEQSTLALREDRTYTYLHFTATQNPKEALAHFTSEGLKRWNDDAERGDLLPLIQAK